ncbi:helix-turn-helix domain-containing protein [Aliarcobacter lanthieri]|uniref:helix-turn-helix domain-containing protein n=1 Tax=Aliarcobacter lanthieri TaxID=1355374 RepID=UPI00192425F5|nr:AraC family transcriptional regulator [Aliarcobacter lanthieri]MBL3520484.1 helix-turn-helix transcriptional regulator [Aliarcobacter lanthieri]
MAYTFTIDDISEFMSSASNNDFTLSLPNDLGYMRSKKEVINDDILIFKTQAKSNENISIHSNSDVDILFINIILEGKMEYRANSSDKSELFKKNDLYIKYIDKCESTSKLEKNSFSKGLAIGIKSDFLEKYLSKEYCLLEKLRKSKYKNVSTFIHKQDTLANIKLANELFNSPFCGKLNDIYLQSKVLEIIYNEFNEINNCFCKTKCNCENVKLSNDDIDALYRAKDIVLLTQDFPDLPSLARKVALNEFKLKFGFRKLFNTTVGQMILERKMIYAKQLLETSEYSVSEVAFYVGYKYQQSFSNAFLQFFGIRPKDVMKKRSYYY